MDDRQGWRKCGRNPHVAENRMSLPATPIKIEERKKQAGFGMPFLWIFSFVDCVPAQPHSPHPCDLAKQKKVSRLQVREPDSINIAEAISL